MTWYRDQNMRVWWNQTLSDSFFVTMQWCASLRGCSLSNFVHSLYRWALALAKVAGVGCHWKHHFVGTVCYADDLALVPSQATLRLMLCFCKQFADSHCLRFNPSKTHLVHFGRQQSVNCFTRFSTFPELRCPFGSYLMISSGWLWWHSLGF